MLNQVHSTSNSHKPEKDMEFRIFKYFIFVSDQKMERFIKSVNANSTLAKGLWFI